MSPILEEVTQGKTVFVVLGQSGDERLVWDASDPKQIKEAMEEFDKLLDGGHIAYLVNEDGTTGEMITARDWARREVREREEILFEKPREVRVVPPLVKG